MNRGFVYVLALLFVLFSFGQDCHACGPSKRRRRPTLTLADDTYACSSYRNLSDPTRRYTYGGGVENDAHLKGWYRFVGGAGTRMLTSCLKMNKCNSACLGHLVGGHPSRSEGAIRRVACFSCYNRCCERMTAVKVKDCGGFYVYYINSIPAMGRLRYCGE